MPLASAFRFKKSLLFLVPYSPGHKERKPVRLVLLFTCVINKLFLFKAQLCSFIQLHFMRKVVLIFPDVTSIAEFLLANKVSKTIIDSSQKTLKGMISDKVLDVAVKQYGARIKESIAVRTFSN